MRCVVGTQIIESGTVTVLGRPAGSTPLRHRVGYVTQEPSVYLDISIRDNVRYFASLYGRGHDAVEDTIEAVGLSTHADHAAGDLSGGQLGRVSLACALVGGPTYWSWTNRRSAWIRCCARSCGDHFADWRRRGRRCWCRVM